jgi:hypothetical protein
MKRLVLFAVFGSMYVLGHSTAKAPAPTLSETMQWLRGATDEESGDGHNHHEFENKDGDSCYVIITETRGAAGPDFWLRYSFSLADIDPTDIRVERLGEGQFKTLLAGMSAVAFHTRNYAKKINSTSNSSSSPIPIAEYSLHTNDYFAPRFAKAFKRAVELCGGKRSSF